MKVINCVYGSRKNKAVLTLIKRPPRFVFIICVSVQACISVCACVGMYTLCLFHCVCVCYMPICLSLLSTDALFLLAH